MVRHPLDVALSCFAQPFEGRGTPWAWTLDGASLLTPSTRVTLSSDLSIPPSGRVMMLQ